MEISVPSKTFILGEYLALEGGPALILTSHPRFKLTISTPRNQDPLNHTSHWFHPHSPAGLFYNKNQSLFVNWKTEFYDPWDGKGGFGASSAQFILLYTFKKLLLNDLKPVNTPQLLEEYLTCSISHHGRPPSGFDLLGQVSGSLSLIEKNQPLQNWHHWPFNDIELLLFRTPFKIATHEHLKSIKTMDFSKLKKMMIHVSKTLHHQDRISFIEIVNSYSNALDSMNLLDTRVKKIINDLKSKCTILAVKGCGAMGCEVILILSEKSHKESLLNWAQSQNLCPLNVEMSEGLKIDFSKLDNDSLSHKV